MASVVAAYLSTWSAFTTNSRGLARWILGIPLWPSTAPQGQVTYAKRLDTYALDLTGVPDFEAALTSVNFNVEVDMGGDIADPTVQFWLYEWWVDCHYDDGAITRFRPTRFIPANGIDSGQVFIINGAYAYDHNLATYAIFPLPNINAISRYYGWTDREVIAQPNVDPQIILRCSNDGGKTFGIERLAAMGKLGNYTQLARWRQLGRSNNRVFEVICSEPVFVGLVEADLDAHG